MRALLKSFKEKQMGLLSRIFGREDDWVAFHRAAMILATHELALLAKDGIKSDTNMQFHLNFIKAVKNECGFPIKDVHKFYTDTLDSIPNYGLLSSKYMCEHVEKGWTWHECADYLMKFTPIHPSRMNNYMAYIVIRAIICHMILMKFGVLEASKYWYNVQMDKAR